MSTEALLDDQEDNRSLSDYLGIINRRKFYFVLPFLSVLVVSTLFVMWLPPIYRSTASILIESQQIPADLVRSTITSYADERIEFIKKKVLTRANILDVIDKYKLYNDQRNSMPATALVRLFRDNIEIKFISANVGRRNANTTIAFTIAFLSEFPKTAQLVTNELVTLFLNENAKTRSERAAETTEFLASEGEKIRGSIQSMEALISDFKLKNRDSLPEVYQVNLTQMERKEKEYQNLNATLEGLQSEIKLLGLQQTQYRASMSGDGQGASLLDLQRELDELSSQYTDQHPEVLRVKRRIEQIKTISPEQAELTTSDNTALLNDPVYAQLRSQVEASESKRMFLLAAKVNLEEELADVEQRISQAPGVEQEYLELNRDLDNLTAKYQDVKNKELEARISQNLEEEQKGERFALLEPPLVPQEPYKPDRSKLLVFGFFLACAAGGGLVLLTEGIDPALRGQTAAARALGSTPLVTIPYIPIGDDIRARKRKWKIGLIAAAGVAIAMLVCVHFFYMNLDVLWYAVMRRLASF